MKAVIALALAACAVSSVCHAQKIPVQITVVGTVPTGGEVKVGNEDFPLTSKPNGLWSGEINPMARGGAKWFRDAELTLTTGNSVIFVPLRLSPETSRVGLTLRIRPTPECNDANLATVEAAQSAQIVQLEMYLLARDFHRYAQTTCGNVAAERMGKAWFDRSHSLAITRDIIRLDKVSIEAAKPRLTTHQLAEYEAEVVAYELRLINDQKKAYMADKKNEWACALNKELSNTLIGMTPEQARRVIAKLFFGHTHIEDDGKLLETYLKKQAETCWTPPPKVVAGRQR